MAARGQFAAIGQLSAAVEQSVGDVVEHAETVEQEELLEDEAETPRPQSRELRCRTWSRCPLRRCGARRGWAARGCP